MHLGINLRNVLKINFKVTFVFMTALQLTSCNSNNFAGDGGKESPPAPPKNGDVIPSPQPQPTTPTSCVPGKTVISVTAKTPSVDQYLADAKIVYEMTIEDCPGTTPEAKANIIQFDVDAQVSDVTNGVASNTRSHALPYKIVVSGNPNPLTGVLNQIDGRDLFGKSGPEYAYYAANNLVSFSATQRRATVEVSISPIRIIQPYGEVQNSSSNTMVINTFFKFGDSAAVTVPVNVTK